MQSEFSIRLLNNRELSSDSPSKHLLAMVQPSAELQAEQNFDLFEVSFSHRKNMIAAHFAQQGALLLRDFPLLDSSQAAKLLKELGVKFSTKYRSRSDPLKRKSNYFRSSAEGVNPSIVPLHTEMCYLRKRPAKVFFYCQTAPEKYGETPVFDTAATFASLDPDLQQKIERLGLVYQRNYVAKKSSAKGGRTWVKAFNTTSKEGVALACAAQKMSLAWQKDGGLLTRIKMPGVVEHPDEGSQCLSMILFNKHAALYNMNYFSHRYGPLKRKTMERAVNSDSAQGGAFIRTLWGDGSEISAKETQQILDAAWGNAVLFKWKAGDLLLLDNIRCGHGRMNVIDTGAISVAHGKSYRAT